MRKLRLLTVGFAAISLSACAGKLEYTPPSSNGQVENTILVSKSRSELWDSLVPRIGKEFFVINNVDKDSGLLNISYSGDPTTYIDCGHITSFVKNARGERTYSFAGASPNQSYEIMNNGLFFVSRRMDLEGRMNVILEEVDSSTSRLTVTTRYVVTKSATVVQPVQEQSTSFSDTISFNTGGGASFPNPGSNEQTRCVPNGNFERKILSLAKD